MLRIDAVPFEEGGAHSSYVVHFLDVTAERLMQQRLLDQEKLAALGHMSAGLAHELNNPLHLVVNFAETFQQSVVELRDELEVMTGLPTDGRHTIDRKLDELADIGSKIVHHGQRASAIAQNMLSRATVDDTWSWLDVNQSLAQAIEQRSRADALPTTNP